MTVKPVMVPVPPTHLLPVPVMAVTASVPLALCPTRLAGAPPVILKAAFAWPALPVDLSLAVPVDVWVGPLQPIDVTELLVAMTVPAGGGDVKPLQVPGLTVFTLAASEAMPVSTPVHAPAAVLPLVTVMTLCMVLVLLSGGLTEAVMVTEPVGQLTSGGAADAGATALTNRPAPMISSGLPRRRARR